ncbi:hypothetical protein GIB67_008064 [Kingdonia uniflora]|uniref:Reverse transcriptase zinc-binding domain-containing protein n=1 Tax=Kingdonia uniflora TaxID=39325 RepID=A0A7J7MNA8_9MAGN|nr:hypothetical protein GIB67_008064 [Kingdonia uniflora]
MAIYKWPRASIKEVEQIIRNFLWSGDPSVRKLVTVSWDKVCKPEEEGNLGILSLKYINMALMMKMGWGFLTSEESWADFFSAKFTKKNGETINYFKPSSIWNGLKGAIMTVENNSRWLIGNGHNIDFWRDCWGADYSLIEAVSVDPKIWRYLYVKLGSIIDHSGWCAPPMVADFLAEHGIDLRNLEVNRNLIDKRVWRHHTQGTFTVRCALDAIRSKNPKVWWNKFMHCQALYPMSKSFLWRVGQNVLATEDNLRRRGLSFPSRCSLCHIHSESIHHLLRDCGIVAPLWLGQKTRNDN